MRTKWFNLSMVLLIVFMPLTGIWDVTPALAQDTPPPSSVTEKGTISSGIFAFPFSPEKSLVMPNCELLDDPESRSLMSGALETALIHACGRESDLSAPARTAAMRPQSPAALGNNVLVTDPAGEMTSMTQSGAVVAYNEDNGVLCAAYDDSYHGVVQGQGYTGFSSSSDGGASWTDRGSLNDADSFGYASLVWRRDDGRFYLATLYNNGLGLWRLGSDCETPVWVGMIHSGTDDKEMLATDNNPDSPYYGYLYVAWTDYADGHIYVARSESGAIWSAPVDLSGHNLVHGAWPAVDPVTGDVYVAWLHWDVYPDGPIDIEMARSDDGGASWSMVTNPMSDEVNPRDATATSNCGRPALNEDIRYAPYPQIAVDRNSNVHVVYSYDPDGHGGSGDVVNVYYRRSLDQGASWEDEIRVNDMGYNDQFSPALAVGETGTVGVFWYDRRLDTGNALYDRYMAVSRDGGMTFEPNQRISSESSPVTHDGSLATCYHGAYDGAAAGDGYFYAVWGDDRRGDADVWSDSEPYFWGGLVGTVYDVNTLHGLEDALVETIHPPTGMTYGAVSDASGGYDTSVPGNEIYTVTAQVYGYASNTVTATVDADGGRADIPLTPVSDWSIGGVVLDADTGYPVYAHVTVSGEPLDPPAPYDETWSDPFTGSYVLPHLAEEIPYTLTFEATGYNPLTYFAGELDADLVNPDLTLEPDLAACTAPGYQMTPPCEVATGAVLQPALLEVEGCPCETQSHELVFANHSAADDEVLLSYATGPGVSAEMPATLGIVPADGVKPFAVMLKIDRGVVYSTTVVVTVTASLASNPAISDTSVIEKRVLDPIAWETRQESPSPSMDGAVIEYGGKLYNFGGNGSGGAVEIYDPATDSWTTGESGPTPNIGFPGDACFGYAAPDDPVILLLPDATGVVTDVWHRYHILTNSWDTPALPSSLPANGIWAADIIVDEGNNTCYITGGASTSGGGDLTTLYRYNPANNSATLLGNFTHIPTGFNHHAGWYVPWIGAAGGICVGGGVDSSSIVYADTQCYDIAAGTFNVPNADLGMLPQPWWGMADAETIHGGNRQLWLANGIRADWYLIERSAYFDREAGEFVYGPDPVYIGYRGEGASVQGEVYLVDGSSSGSVATTWNQRLLQCSDCERTFEVTKTGPAWAYTGDVVSYTVVITRLDWLSSTVMLSDMLPPGVTYAGGLSASSGTAWYSDTEDAVYWTVQPVAGVTTPGAALEMFNNAWATATVGLAYNPFTDYVRYVHESASPPHIHDVALPAPHSVLHSWSLSQVNAGWPTSQDWRSGAAYDPATGHYFLADYGGGGAYSDNITEIDPAGRIINGWETNGVDNDSYDGSSLASILDIAVVPGSPTRYFATRFSDGGVVYELDLVKNGLFVDDTWGTVMTCTVPGVGDTAGIDYDAQNGVLYHSGWDSNTIVVSDLACNPLATFTCGDAGTENSGITFIEGQWPPEVWVINHDDNTTHRCEAVGNELLPEVVTVTFNVTVTAPAFTTVNNAATLEYEARGETPSPAILHLRTTNTSGSVRRALDQLGYTYDVLYSLDWTGIDFAPYDVVVIGMSNGAVDITSTRKLRTDVIDQGKHLVILGGSSFESFVLGVDQYLVAHDTGNYDWSLLATTPHFTLLDAAHPLAQGLPLTRDFVTSGASYYQLRVTDPEIEAVAQNGDGYTNYFRKTYPGGGELVWFIDSVYTGFWSDPADFQLLLRIIGNAMPHTREIVAEQAFLVAGVTWTKEVYVNGSYFGHPEDGPFTVSPGDDVQIVDRLDYVGHEPLFVQLDEDWAGYPVELLDASYTHGVVVSADGDWAVTLPPGTSARLAKTLRVTDTVPVTLIETLRPDGLPEETHTLSLLPPAFAKDGPSVAYNGQIITYTLTYESQSPLLGSLLLTDALPAGVEFAGGLQASYGDAWYDAFSRSVHWRNLPSGAQTLAAMATTPGEVARTAPASPSATWLEAAAIPQGVTRYAHAQCPGDTDRFYVVSGSRGIYTDAAWRYDAGTNAWTVLAPFPNPVEGASAVCYQGKLYVAGGGGTSQFYIYDILRDTWSEGPALPRPVWGAAMAAWDGRLYLAGGDSDLVIGDASDEVNVYDVALGAWIGNGATMPQPTTAPGWTQVGRYLYVVGGWSSHLTQNLTSTLRYDIAYNYWEPGPVFTSARGDFVLAATGQYLYAIGGDADGSGAFNAVTLTERLDYTHWYTDSWTDINDPLPGPLTGHRGGFCTTAMSGGEIWSVGGVNTSGSGTFTDTNQYRPSEPCVTTPFSVTLTFNVRVTAGAGEHVTNPALLDDDGFIFTAETAFDVPMPDWDKQVNDETWSPGFRVLIEVSDTLTVTDVVSTPSAFTLQESWDSDKLQLTGYVTSTGTTIENPWQQAGDMPFAYTRFAGEYSYTTGKVYFLGGRTGAPTDGSIWEFDPATGVYTDTGTDMPVPISNYSIARLTDDGGNEVLVTFGGRTGSSTYMDTVQAFYPESGTVSVLTSDPYPLATSAAGVAVVDNIAYVFGGFDAVAVTADTYIFDITAPSGSRWTAGPSLNQARGYLGSAVVDGIIYAIGGDEFTYPNLIPLTVVERLDPSAGTPAWDDAGVADLPFACDEMPAFGFDAASPYPLAGSVVVAGCGRWPDEYADALRYDVASDTWDAAFVDLNEARRNHAGAFIPAGDGEGMPGLWVWGGRQDDDDNVLSSVEVYPLAQGNLVWQVPYGDTSPATLTKVFRVLPGDWTQTVLEEELSIGTWSENRSVILRTAPVSEIYLPLVLRNYGP